MKRQMTIERLLHWAYCEELPKARPDNEPLMPVRSAWASVSSYAELLTVVDENRYGVVPLMLDAGEPHPDALRVHEAVLALDAIEPEFSADWQPMPELKAFGDLGETALRTALNALTVVDRDGRRQLKEPLSECVIRFAILGRWPEANLTEPLQKVAVTGPGGGPLWFRNVVTQTQDITGQPVEFAFESPDGWDASRHRPKRGAYQKFRLSPDPVPVLIGRAEASLLAAALGALEEQIRNDLEGVRLAPDRQAAGIFADGPLSRPQVSAIW